eukprot:CAMPEP_0116057606 /NCGR_PEP_ID=MMETSP0322-20121206/4710_1 /TAXON_ID=163516 /ORGANISM="Leptocylindrus danicus var. apora, Strain B651" /LENGTH=813 /DNA_ID=CAMNT_0003541647 /DNA_START=648 /DNA_END=3089 /DNA_ORIENTATION=+
MNLIALNSNEMSQDLYVAYINATYVDLDHNREFDSLPLALQRAYTISACNCLPGSADCTSSCTAETSFVDLSVLSMDSIEASVRVFKICGRIQYGYEVSNMPSLPPTPAPTPSPSETPSSEPSPGPSMMASSQPTADPTETPTDAPTPIASMQPSKGPIPAPHASPSAGPTLFTGSLAIKFQYSLTTNVYYSAEDIFDDIGGNGVRDALESAMSTSTEQVLQDLGYATSDRFLSKSSQRRRLPVSLTEIDFDDIKGNGCTSTTTDKACYIVTNTLNLSVESENKGTVLSTVTEALNSLLPTTFVDLANESNSSSDIFVDAGPNPVERDFSPPTPAPTSSDSSLDTGIIAGIAVGCSALALTAGYSFYRQRKRQKQMYTREGEADGAIGAKDVNFILYGDGGERGDFRPLNDDEVSEGGSGWSSNGTNPNDQRYNQVNTLAAVAVASGNVARYSDKKNRNSSIDDDDEESETSSQMIAGVVRAGSGGNEPVRVTRGDLDRAIDAGDWAVVGATAALLANQSGPESSISSPNSKASRSTQSRANMTEVDRRRANELGHLVDTGDWEGVVLAAAKFESNPPMARSDESASFYDNQTTNTFNTSVGSDTQTNRKRAEIRAEVERLVRKVVPDESENIDEMMRQFEGREEELLETLRSMQEKAIAQRQRLAMQKNAKRQATQTKETVPVISPLSSQDKDETSQFSDPQFDGIPTADGVSSSGKSNNPDEATFGGVPTSINAPKDSKKKQLQIEEEQALAQAELWEKIAAENAPEDKGGAKGASAATDWAIARSLKKLEASNSSANEVQGKSTTEEEEV